MRLLEDIEKDVNAATPGPWEKHPHQSCIVHMRNNDYDFVCMYDPYGINEGQWKANRTFIANARTDILDLIVEVRKLRAVIDWLKEK